MKSRTYTLVIIALAAALTAGCASVAERDSRDPLESMNRAVFSFNEGVDKAVVKPLAKGYKTALPRLVQNGIRNVFSNLDDATEFANNLLQFKIQAASSDVMRVAATPSFAFMGLCDIAAEMRLQRHTEDFGQTLGRWGFANGPYLVLPIFGPCRFRDGLGLAVDSHFTDPVYQIKDVASRNDALGLQLIGQRADKMDALAALEEAALDKYEFTRDFYLDRRAGLVYDGRPPASE